jgi:pre-mRNA-processing factor SLU7
MSKINSNKEENVNSEINPHMPQYIVKAPWYLNQTEVSLKHQKAQVEVNKIPIDIYTMKGLMKNQSVYKFRKGACENCGAISHKTKECCERPRKKGSKWTGKDFCQDEYICEVPLDYEGKRDRWSGYNPDSFKRIMVEHERFQEEKRRVKEAELHNITDEKERRKLLKDEDLDESVSSEDDNLILEEKEQNFNNKFEKINNIPDEFKAIAELLSGEDKDNPYLISDKVTDKDVLNYLDSVANSNDPKKIKSVRDIPKNIVYQMCTSKSLQIGDDYSKYLLNLALNSAYYDGKSRSMRENPNPGSLHTFRGDNYTRNTGDTLKLIELENFIREANDKNKDLNLDHFSMPSQAELFRNFLENKKTNYRSDLFKKVIQKYGGEEYLQVPDEVKNSNVTENIDTYDEDYAPFSDQVRNTYRILNKSIYPEDVHINNHTSVWGSFYHKKFCWGYKCCLSFDRNSFCNGEDGIRMGKKLILDYDAKIQEELRKEKEIIKEKDENLRKRNIREENEGIFNETFERMEKYEQSGKVEQFLNKKLNRDNE